MSLAHAQEPKFEWAKGIGGRSNDFGFSIAVDAIGNCYTTGYFSGEVDFDPGEGIFNLTTSGGIANDIFILKLDSLGNFVWAKRMGGVSYDAGYAIAVDNESNIIITGSFEKTVDFDPDSSKIFNLTSQSESDVFILKLNASGKFVWAKKIGDSVRNRATTIATDFFGNVYVGGGFWETTDFDPGNGIFNLTSSGDADIFILKLNALGGFVWAKSMGGILEDNLSSLAIDSYGNVYSIGDFETIADFNPDQSQKFELISGGLHDAFISKLNTSGNFLWAKSIRGNHFVVGSCIVIDKLDNINVAGWFDGTIDIDSDIPLLYLSSAGIYDIFNLKLNSEGKFIWAKTLGGFSEDYVNSMAVDAFGNVFTTGSFQGTADFDPGIGSFNLTASDPRGLFVSKLDSKGNFIWAINTGIDGYSIATDKLGNVYTSGRFSDSINLKSSLGTFYLVPKGANDILVFKISTTIQNEKIDKILIYPNPTTGILNIKSEGLNNPNLKIQILNSIGQIVMEETSIQHLALGETGSQLNIQHLPEGLYLVRVISENKIIATQKIIKQ